MPFPARGVHSLTHVSYTPHFEWSEVPTDRHLTQLSVQFPLTSRFDRMVRDAARYLPWMIGTSYVDSLWEVKQFFPRAMETTAGRSCQGPHGSRVHLGPGRQG